MGGRERNWERECGGDRETMGSRMIGVVEWEETERYRKLDRGDLRDIHYIERRQG